MMTALFKLMLVILSLNFAKSQIVSIEAHSKNIENFQSAMHKLVSATQEMSKFLDNDYILNKPSSCAELILQGYMESGIYTIYPRMWFEKSEVNVYCDMETDGGGWTVIQRRDDFLPRQNFTQDWEAYRRGFGQLNKEFWLGNDNLFILTNQDFVTLRIDLEDYEGNNYYVIYEECRVLDCRDKYRLQIGKFSGTTGDSLTRSNNSTFSAFDNDNAQNCSNERKSGGWFENCSRSNLNGIYFDGSTEFNPQLMYWRDAKEEWFYVKKSEMKIRPTHFHLPLK